MEIISSSDREILRNRARIQLEYASSARNDEIMAMWRAQAQGKREGAPVRLLFSSYRNEVITPRLQCQGKFAREVETKLLSTLVGRELFDDDTPIFSTFDVPLHAHVEPFGIQAEFADRTNAGGYHIKPAFDELAGNLDKLRGGHFGVDKKGTEDYCNAVNEIIGDILPARIVMPCLNGAITNPLVHLMGMENYLISMMDEPDELHELMDMATAVYERYYDYLEENGLLLPTNNGTPLQQESFAFSDELPADAVTSTRQVWGFLESQETTAVSPDMFGEFVFPYEDRLVRRYGLLSYGCCERVDALWPDYLSKWDNLRKLSVSPFNNEKLIGEYLRGSRVVYYSKPRAEFVTNAGPLDEEGLRAYYKGVFESASGCMLEVAQREVGTIHGDIPRAKRYVEITKECVQEYWKP